MNAKAKGSRRERQTIELLQAQDYSCTCGLRGNC
jgi:hypothetical protein